MDHLAFFFPSEECNQIEASHDEVGYDETSFESFPPGYRFEPTDEELIVYYLRNKVYHQPLPSNLIKEVLLYDSNPIKLSEEYKPIGEIKWYFFTPIDKRHPEGGRVKQGASNGYWKATGSPNPVKSSEGVTVGHKRTLVFYEGDRPGIKTKWIMHEYKVADPPKRTNNGPNDIRLDDCILCKIYHRTTQSASERPHA